MAATGRKHRRARLDPGARDRMLAQSGVDEPADVPESGLAALREIIVDLQGDGPADMPEPTPSEPPVTTRPDTAANWRQLATVPVDAVTLDDNLIITGARTDPAHGAFDVLRSRMVLAMAERGWRRVGITSPTKGCGKTFTALNLAVTLSRYGGERTVLLDLDLRMPALARTLGVTAPDAIGEMLRGNVAPLDHLRCFGPNQLHIGRNVALGLNDLPEPYAAELFHTPEMTQTLARIEAELAPDLMLFDLPPALAQDDVIALAPHYDCILMVVGGGVTTAHEVHESLRRIGEDKPVLGMILNKAEGGGEDGYRYAY